MPSETHLIPSVEVSELNGSKWFIMVTTLVLQRGMHNIEHQITYPGSNFIFHDSKGFEAGAIVEIEDVWAFIEKRSSETELKNQLHVIW
jgi:hypothetical protein